MAANRKAASLVLILSLISSEAHAATPATHPATRPAAVPTTQRVNTLIANLANDDWKERQKAMDDLGRLGGLAEAQLRAKLKENPEPGTVAAIEALLRQIGQMGKFAPTPITLKLHDVTPAEAAAAFAREAKIEFAPGTDSVWSASPKKIDLDLDAAPMWQALLELCKQTHVSLAEVNREGKVVLAAFNEQNPPPPLATSGAFLVLLSRVEFNITLARDFAGPKPMNVRNNNLNNPACRLYLFPFAEPRLKAVHWFIDSVDECVTDTGNKVEVDLRRTGRASGRIGGYSRETQLNFSTTPQGNKISRLKMTARFVLQQGTEKLEVPNILTVKNSTHMVGGFRLVIAGVSKIGEGRYTYDISIFRDAHTEAEFSLLQSLISSYECKLLDANDQALTYNGGNSSYSRDKLSFNNTLNCDRGNVQTGEPVKLVWEIPFPTEQIVVPLEFKDIELPK